MQFSFLKRFGGKMIKEFEYVIKLQKIDNQLLEINDMKGDLPQIVDTLQQEIKTLEKELESERKREKEIILEIKDLEGKIQDDNVHLERYQDQLYLVTSNKEYDALSSEIDTMKQDIDKAEYSILELNEEMDKIKESIKSKDLTHQDKVKKLYIRKTELDKTNNKTKSVKAKLQKERTNIIKSIPLRYFREYNRIAKAKEGVAIVPIQQVFIEKKDKKGNIEYIPAKVSCSGCHKIVPPQKVVEIRSGNKLNRCEFCGRLLYWDDKISEIKSNNNEEEIF